MRKKILVWCFRMEKYNIPCPRVITLKKHVLVMEFIGENQIAAPQLRHAKLSSADAEVAYDQCIDVSIG